jgi:hypothetical protein
MANIDQMQVIASHKVASVGQDASRRCTRRPGGPDRDTFSVCSPMQMDQDGWFASARCVGPLEMPLGPNIPLVECSTYARPQYHLSNSVGLCSTLVVV